MLRRKTGHADPQLAAARYENRMCGSGVLVGLDPAGQGITPSVRDRPSAKLALQALDTGCKGGFAHERQARMRSVLVGFDLGHADRVSIPERSIASCDLRTRNSVG